MKGFHGTVLLFMALGCKPYSLDKEALLKPESCVDCHPSHVEEWSEVCMPMRHKTPYFER